MLGLGTYPMNRWTLVRAVLYARSLGYVRFDTASAYQNERWLGRALKVARVLGGNRRLFVTTKLSNGDQREGDVRLALEKSMSRLGLEKPDLYLMHWPNPETYLTCWRQMEDLYREGRVGAIGVCNFHPHHLDRLLKIATVVPAINQVELHPLLSQAGLRAFCHDRGIVVEAYSPVARMNTKLIHHPLLMSLAGKYGKTVPQIILRWDLQHGIPAVPKSSRRKGLKENISLFDFCLTEMEMEQMDGINENLRCRFDPDNCDFSKL